MLTLSPAVVETEPGQIISASFSVRSATDQSEEFVESLALPDDWQAVIQPTSFVLDPQETVVRLAAFLVPGNASSGSYQITYSVRSRRDYAIQDSGAITAVVLPVTKLELLVEEKPDAVIAGDSYQVSFRAVNRSNSPLRVSLQASSSLNNPVSLDTGSLDLPVGGTQLVTATVRTNEKLRRRTSDVLSIRVIGAGGGDEVISSGLTVTVELIPKFGEDVDIYHRVPSEIRLMSAGGGDDSGLQVEFAAHGSLDEAGVRTVDLLFRGPDIDDTSFFGLRDEYRLSYFTPDMDLQLGDQSYGLSPLTDYYRYGRGAGLSYRSGSLSSGAFFVEDRWGSVNRQEMGLYIGRDLGNGLGLRLNLLAKSQDTPSGFDDTLLSLQGFAKPFRGANLEAELGICSTDRSVGTDGQAYRIRLDGSSGGVSYSVGSIHASPDYFGYYNDADYSNASVTFPIAGRLRGNVSGQRWRRNLDLDVSQPDAPLEKSWQIGLDYYLSESTRLSLDRVFFSREDLLQPAEYDYEERALRLGINKAFGTSSLQVYWDIGRQHDMLIGDSHSVNRYAVYYYQRAGRNQYISFYSLFGDDGDEESRLLGSDNTIGGSVLWKPSDRISLSMSYTTNRFRLDEDRDNRQFYATAVYNAPNDRAWTLRFRNSNHTLSSETSYMLTHTIPFGIPVARKKSLGGISGRVYDAEHPDRPGIPRVVVNANGATTVTNDKGEFSFRTLPSGPCRVSVEQRSIGLERVTETRLPTTVDVQQGKTVSMQIGVLRSARLRGKVSLMRYQSGKSDQPDRPDVFVSAPDHTGGVISADGQLAEVGGLRDVLLELTNGGETLRRVTDSDGEFSLTDLRPGLWTLKVYDHNLPALHYLEQPEFSIELAPGGEVTLPIKVLPRLRQINIIEQDSIR